METCYSKWWYCYRCHLWQWLWYLSHAENGGRWIGQGSCLWDRHTGRCFKEYCFFAGWKCHFEGGNSIVYLIYHLSKISIMYFHSPILELIIKDWDFYRNSYSLHFSLWLETWGSNRILGVLILYLIRSMLTSMMLYPAIYGCMALFLK